MTTAIRDTYSHLAMAAVILSCAVLLGTTMVLLSDQSIAWAILVVLGLGFVATMFWSGNPKNTLFYTFLLTVPIDISKAIIVPVGDIYTPGLYANISDVFFVGFVLIWLFDKALVQNGSIRFDRVTKAGLAFTIYMWLSALLAVDTFAGLLVAVSHTKFFLVFLIVADTIKTPKQLKEVAVVLAAGLALQLAMIAAQQLTGSYLALAGAKVANTGNLVFSGAGGLHAFRPTGFLNHPILLADYLVFLLLPLFGLVLLGRRRLGVVWLISLLLFLGASVAMVLTLARSGWIVFLLCGIVFLFVGFKKGVVSHQQIAALIFLAFLGAATVAVVYPAAYLRLTESDQRSSEGRVLMMEQARLIVSRNPIFGVGLGGYNRAARINIPESFSNVGKDFQDGLIKLGVVHNKYLLVAAEHGLVGLFLFAFLLWQLIRLFFTVRKWRDQIHLTLGLGLACGIIGQGIFYLFEHFYIDIGVQLLWVFGGILVALVRMQQPAKIKHHGRLAYE